MYHVAVQATSYLAFPNKTSRFTQGVLLDQSTPVRTTPITCMGYNQVHSGVYPGGYVLLGTSDSTVEVYIYS